MEDIIGIKDGININSLLTNGVTFDVNNIQDALNEAIDEDNDGDEDMYVANNNHDPIGNYIKEPFPELWKKMKSIEPNDLIRKIIVKESTGEVIHDKCIIKIMFCIYFDGESKPHSSTKKFSPYIFCLEDSGLLPGIETAIRSMVVGEHSRFLIHHSLMYGELGCPPDIPKRAMCLLHCIVMSTSEKDSITDTNSTGGGIKMKDSFKKIKTSFAKGISLYKVGNFMSAQSVFNKTLDQLKECRLANYEDEKIQKELLLKLYLNLAICYNKMNWPLKACSICNEFNRICKIWSNWKILFQNAKALMMIGEFEESRKKLQRAEKLNPDSDEIKSCMKTLNIKETIVKKYQDDLTNFLNNDTKSEKDFEGFKEEIKLLCVSLKTDTQLDRYVLNIPNTLSDEELNIVNEVVKNENFILKLKENDNEKCTSITISKT